MKHFEVTAEVEQLVARLLEDRLDVDQMKRLEVLLKENPKVVHYYQRMMLLHATLKHEISLVNQNDDTEYSLKVLKTLAGVNEPEAVKTGGIVVERTEEKKRSTRWIGIAAGLLIPLLIGLMFMFGGNDGKDDVPIAMVMESINTIWTDQDGKTLELATGSELHAMQLVLKSGIAKIKYHRGMLMVFDARKGAVSIDLRNDHHMHMENGEVTVDTRTHEKKDEGFTVSTKTHQFVDKGAEYFMSTDQKGKSDAFVFSGSVSLNETSKNPTTEEKTHVLKKHDHVKIEVSKPVIIKKKVSPKLYTNVAQFNAIMIQANELKPIISGACEFSTDRMGVVEPRERLLVTLERGNYVLTQAVRVDVANPSAGRYDEARMLKMTPGKIPSGTKVHSYVITCTPASSGPARVMINRRARVTFKGRIIGIMGTDAGLLKAHDEIGGGLTPPLNSIGGRDFVTLREDLRTLDLKWETRRGYQNAIRVLVRVE